ncbi:Serine/threonine protein kinase [Handroanthus impetiginosus]|uniref:non-specific serine/threonine protein kinase n=1 Tax=Handroanthus impetiginosus TaxID=429701 RepID=A0A2G9GH90_9LAMI|nr:Serine/threonine protein kinase [Handroanthus impetiginosus]
MTINVSSIKHNLSKPTSIFGLKLWIALVIIIALILFLVIIFTLIFISWRYKRNEKKKSSYNHNNVYRNCSMDQRLSSQNGRDRELSIDIPEKEVVYSDRMLSNGKIKDGVVNDVNDVECVASDSGPISPYTLKDIEVATNGFAYGNMIGSGDFGVVFRGVLMDNTQVAVKKLFRDRSRKTTFVKEAEELLLISHKNLVKLLGYCAEETYRILVYEYVGNGSLDQWLHGCINEASPLAWNVRMNIIIGVAKGLAYLHEDILSPHIHGNLKSSNILLDREWNPKISNVGTRRLLGPEWKNSTLPTGMLGYIAPECDHTFVPDEKSDVYSFGVLIMEIVTGKSSMVSTFSEVEELLVDWVKFMVAQENYDVIFDSKLLERPTMKELKRILLISLRCVDFEVEKMPKMREIMHMLEPRNLLLADV